MAKPAQDARAIVGLIVLAAIAYADAVTANRAQVVNQQDHASAWAEDHLPHQPK